MTNNKPRSPVFQPKMESIVYLVAEWISFREMKALQSACMLVSIKAREKKYEEFLSDVDNQVWKEMSEEWQQYLMGKEESPAMVNAVEIYRRSCGFVCRMKRRTHRRVLLPSDWRW